MRKILVITIQDINLYFNWKEELEKEGRWAGCPSDPPNRIEPTKEGDLNILPIYIRVGSCYVYPDGVWCYE